MRFSLTSIPSILLLILPTYVAYSGSGILWVILLTMAWFVLRQAIVIYSVMTRRTDKRIVLKALSVSHYVEKVRWTLDLLGVEYEEEADVGIMGAFIFGRLVPGLHLVDKNTTIYNSSDILRYLYGTHAHLGDLSAKTKFLRPTPEALELERRIDDFGNSLRVFVYFHCSEETLFKLWGMNQENVPQWQKVALKILFPVLLKWKRKALNVNVEGARNGLAKSKALFDEIDNMLSDGRQFLLGGDQASFVDVAFASLASLLVWPAHYGGGSGAVGALTLPKLGDFTKEYQKESEAFRARPSGKFVLRMYEKMRVGKKLE